VFTWRNAPVVLPGKSLGGFNYSADSQSFSKALNVVARDPFCQ
jgi:hypothetical protein